MQNSLHSQTQWTSLIAAQAEIMSCSLIPEAKASRCVYEEFLTDFMHGPLENTSTHKLGVPFQPHKSLHTRLVPFLIND